MKITLTAAPEKPEEGGLHRDVPPEHVLLAGLLLEQADLARVFPYSVEVGPSAKYTGNSNQRIP